MGMIFELWNCRLKVMLEKLSKPKQEEKALIPTAETVPVPVKKAEPEPNRMPPLKMNDLSHAFKTMDDNYYEKALKVTALELTHAQSTQIKQLELQIEKEKRSRLVSGFT